MGERGREEVETSGDDGSEGPIISMAVLLVLGREFVGLVSRI